MAAYKSDLPLVFSHVPKTAGISMRRIFRVWAGEDLVLHYPGSDPKAGDPRAPVCGAGPGRPRVIYGHFNRARGFGLEHVFSGPIQIMTMVRDPWDRAISGYFFRRSRADRAPGFRKVAEMTLEDYLSGWPYADPAYGPPMANFLPDAASVEALIERLDACCLAVGTTDRFEATVRQFARVLGRPTPDLDTRVHVNRAPRDQPEPLHLKPAFLQRARRDVAIYEWARARLARDMADV